MNNKQPFRVPSTRAQIVTRRTYVRPKDESVGEFESWQDAVNRVKRHQKWLWERAKGSELSDDEEKELDEFAFYLYRREGSVSGRTLWLGGTDIAKRRESSQFNCAFSFASSVNDIVDLFWNLLQGTGVGFEPIPGILSGFTHPVEIEIVDSIITMDEWNNGTRGLEKNKETHSKGQWRIVVGDSAEAWAKVVGKLFANKKKTKKLILDFSQIRPAGIRLKGYGWISSGHITFKNALIAIAEILNDRSGELLTRMDILDVMNHLGTSLSSRRSAEIALVPFNDPEWDEFAMAKKNFWQTGKYHRAQSNNSIVFYQRPSKLELRAIFDMIKEGGGSEPGFINGENAKKRAPWWKGVNPCLTGDTIIPLADGNGTLKTIKEIAEDEETNDVPIYALNDNGDVIVETLRGIQITRKNADVYKVVLDNGQEIKATADHKFRLSSGEWKEVQELDSGDSLWIISQYESSLFSKPKSQKYRWVNNKGKNEIEHKIIARDILANGKSIDFPEYVVHHKDYNGLNNAPDNLEILTKEEHDRIHADNIMGEKNPIHKVLADPENRKVYLSKLSQATSGLNNPNALDISNDDIFQHAIALCKIKERAPTYKEWIEYSKENGIPFITSTFRLDNLGCYSEMITKALHEADLLDDSIKNIDLRTIRTLYKWKEMGYNVKIDPNKKEMLFECFCEITKETFWSKSPYSRFNLKKCSRSDVQKHFYNDPANRIKHAEQLKNANKTRKDKIKDEQIKVFNTLKFELGRDPSKKEWKAECEKTQISSEISRKTSPFRYWNDLKEEAAFANHKIVSVEYCGKETVYDGIVNNVHNFFILGSKRDLLEKTNKGIEKYTFINSSNCGEIALGDKSYCNLVEIDLSKFNGRFEELKRVLWIFARANYRQTCVDFRDGILQDSWHELNQFLRLCGVGLTGIVQWEHLYNKDAFKELKDVAYSGTHSMADELDLPRSKAATTIKPSGCSIPSDRLCVIQEGKEHTMSYEELFKLAGYDLCCLEGEERTWYRPKAPLPMVIDENRNPQEITGLFVNGYADVYEIEFEDNSIHTFTGDHKLMTKDGKWKKVSELTESDELK